MEVTIVMCSLFIGGTITGGLIMVAHEIQKFSEAFWKK
jgi:hypothetical protein